MGMHGQRYCKIVYNPIKVVLLLRYCHYKHRHLRKLPVLAAVNGYPLVIGVLGEGRHTDNQCWEFANFGPLLDQYTLDNNCEIYCFMDKGMDDLEPPSDRVHFKSTRGEEGNVNSDYFHSVFRMPIERCFRRMKIFKIAGGVTSQNEQKYLLNFLITVIHLSRTYGEPIRQ